ncbi:isoprenoid synthase domain-containing protein [Talaromyces proteolyticus]|uniref:Isoprenoid synthase domain-containing protein n=1 Tax=Talaromyces proteolyticus TaxID=1131652 RepID=A0AAD4PXJ2_9EURO|nr:isoprenoid synthase domain-containing protein [Talaromyces proteolyticus]KAH8696424.1 isoprenoid synthase domain-containing protein [Talaromyces proteolyticus]
MLILDDFPFQHSRVLNHSELPEGYFHILPFRVSEPREGMLEAILAAKDDWERSIGKEATPLTAAETDCPLIYVLPECPSNMVAPIVDFGTKLVLWDDETDILDRNTHKAIIDDYCLGLISEIKQGKRLPCEFEINNVYLDSVVRSLKQIGGNGDAYKNALQSFDFIMRSQSAPPLHEVTFEEYKRHRSVTIAGKLLEVLIPSIYDLEISREEQDSVLSMLEFGYLAVGLANDLYSFPKEFDEHACKNSLDVIHNAMAVLMSNYGYTEDESREILKKEILLAERSLLDAYQTWKASSVNKSNDLRRYMVIAILAVGGGCFYQARSPRYHGRELGTSATDRAQLIGRSNKDWKLPGHPSPQLFNKSQISDVVTTQYVDNSSSCVTDILAPFQKAQAESICMEPYNYTKSLPGKNTVGKFIECLRIWFHVSDDSAAIIERVTTMLFHSTLMIDDIEDESTLRRGKPAAHVVFGMSQTINSATFAYAKASIELELLNQARCKKAFLDELETLSLGQGLDLYWKFHKICPSTAEYLTMVDNKTGGFFRMVLRLMEVESNAVPCGEALHLVTLLGRYYQIRDDYLNLTSDEYTAKKGFCDDLSEGKFSFPLIHLLQNSRAADIVRGLLFHRENSLGDILPETKAYILSEMRDTGSLAHTRDTLAALFDGMMTVLGKAEHNLGPNKRLRAFLLWLKL